MLVLSNSIVTTKTILVNKDILYSTPCACNRTHKGCQGWLEVETLKIKPNKTTTANSKLCLSQKPIPLLLLLQALVLFAASSSSFSISLFHLQFAYLICLPDGLLWQLHLPEPKQSQHLMYIHVGGQPQSLSSLAMNNSIAQLFKQIKTIDAVSPS